MIYYNYGIKNSRIFKKNGLEKTIGILNLKVGYTIIKYF
jgi:hypothetical protein